jgi:hypothetical protein
MRVRNKNKNFKLECFKEIINMLTSKHWKLKYANEVLVYTKYGVESPFAFYLLGALSLHISSLYIFASFELNNE